jgi:FRG domain
MRNAPKHLSGGSGQGGGPIKVASYQDLLSRLEKMESSHEDGLLCYRGQVRDYPRIVPSMTRRVDSDEFELKETIYGHGFWRSVAEEIAREHLPEGDWDRAVIRRARLALGEGILQHYGFQTYFVDVTFNPDVALCFAHYQYRDLYPVFDGDFDRPKLRRVAWYEPSLEPHGYLYVFDCVRWRPDRGGFRHGEVIQLSNLARPGWNRVQMQQAMVIHSDPRESDSGDLRPFVRATFKLPLPLPGADAALEESRRWFPGPKDDAIYRNLLGSKFVEQTYIADHPVRVWRRATTDADAFYLHVEIPAHKEITMMRRTLEIPEYHDDPQAVAEIELFRSFDKVLEPTFFFMWFKACFGSTRCASWLSNRRAPDAKLLRKASKGHAILVHVPFTYLKYLDGNITRVRYHPREAVLNVFLEFSMYNFSGPYADDRAIRGVWIAGTAERFQVAVMGAMDGRPWIGDVGIFEWSERGYDASAATRPEMRQYFIMALTLLSDLSEGRAELLPLHEGESYQQMRYPVGLDVAETDA